MKEYASKLLLFGEHTVINSSKALAIPYGRYFGSWGIGVAKDTDLLAFAKYLQSIQGNHPFLRLDTFVQELEKGAYFKSNIPTGYGLGSSGALCAAIYDRYALHPIHRDETKQLGILRGQLAQMEHYFHGSSSGTDPLICYLQHAVIIDSDSSISKTTLPVMKKLPFTFFLLDTKLRRKTGPLVNMYLDKCKKPDYAHLIRTELVPQVNAAINDFLAANWLSLGEIMVQISQFQFQYFAEMIPESLRSVWKTGLDRGTYSLKLCGAGGGGFLLGVAFEKEILQDLNANFPCEPIWGLE